MITAQGIIPFPPNADARPIQRLASDLQRLGDGLQQGSSKMTGTANAARSSWVGQASDAFAGHVDRRASTVSAVAQAVTSAVPILETFAAAIETTSAAYSTAAVAENVARAGMPWTSAALAAAIAAESAALVALQGAGIACAGALVAVEIELAAAQFLGVSRETFTALKDTATSIWEGISELGEGVDADEAVRLLNTTITIPHGDGSSTRTTALGWLLESNPRVNLAVQAFEALGGVGVLLTAPTVRPVERPELAAQVIPAGVDASPDARQLGQIMANLEDLKRPTGTEVDQSVSILVTRGTAPDGSQVVNVVVPGIVPPGAGSVFGDSGTRNVTNAAADQITGMSTETLAIRRWLDTQGLKPGDTVNFFAHSQGGIVSRNVANDLINDGFEVNVVSYGSPDGQYREGVGAYMVQNLRDPVPAARIGGDAPGTSTLYPGQHIVTFDRPVPGDAFAAHDARVYGDQIARDTTGSSGMAGLNGFLAGQEHVRIDDSKTTVVTFEGPCTPSGVCDAVPIPSSGYHLDPRP